jgi:hypothetical protein
VLAELGFAGTTATAGLAAGFTAITAGFGAVLAALGFEAAGTATTFTLVGCGV